jgi:DNA-binding CsgD family transcriptional regulator
MLLGRAAECEQLVELLDTARRGTSGVLVITGEPGVGKSALLEYARGHTDALVLSAVGAETESEIPYAALADVFRSVLDQIEQLPPRQAEALSGALALGTARAGDRFGVAAATLSLLGTLASAGPVVVLVDDAQWIDYFSCEALAFTANRLGAEGITLLLSMREGSTNQAAFARHPLLAMTGLDDTSARQLIVSRGQNLGPMVTARLIAEAGGNPLALRELPALLAPDELAVWGRGLDPMPIDSVLQEAFSTQVRDLPAQTQQSLLLVATLGSVPYEVVEQAMAEQGLDHAAVEAAEQAGLLVNTGGRWSFRHPLMRAAVYHSAPRSRQRRAHLSAATALESSAVPNALERRSWHLVSAGGSADESLARTLEDAGEEELARSNFAVASKLFERSAQLTTLADRLAPRLLRSADSSRLAGAIEDTVRLLERAKEVATAPEVKVAVDYYLSRIEIWRGTPTLGRDQVLGLANLVEPFNTEVAAQMFSDAALASVEIGDFAVASDSSERAIALLTTETEAPLATVAVRALVLGLRGEMAPAHDLLSEHAEGFDTADALAISQPSTKRSSANDQLSLVAALAHLAIEEADRAGTLLERAVTQARDYTAIGVLPFRLGRLAWVQYWQGRWAASRSSAAEALLLAEDTGWVAERPNSLAAMARIEAAMGLADECRQHAELAAEAAAGRGTRPNAMYARGALGLLELSLGNDADAVDHLEQVAAFADECDLTDTPLLWWSGDLIEAYAQQGRNADAARVLARLEARVEVSRRPVAAAVLSRCRAILDPTEAEHHLTEALRLHEHSGMPFEQARTELRLGIHLRRQRLRGEAQTQLESALATFERLGAAPWRDRARAELEASGVHLGERPTDLASLTPQEFQVAQNVARGMSNREIAAAMFLSVKTVEYHLGNAFHKLDVQRRSQLAILVSQHDRDPVAPFA